MRVFAKLALGMALIPILAACERIEAFLAPGADLWPRWQAHDAAATMTIDHAAWGEFLDAYLRMKADGISSVAYGEVSAAHRKSLKAYIRGLAALPISAYARSQQRAYWVNLYNSLTVDMILSHYPVDSIVDLRISPGFFSFGPWDKKLIQVEGEMLSLNDIEHRILRPIWKDPRLHYVINCAALGCPNLPTQPLTGKNGEQTLNDAARIYVNHSRGARVEDGRAVVSKIYNWFADDFGRDKSEILAHIRRYAEPPLTRKLEGAAQIDGYQYDWALNDSKRDVKK